MERLSDFKPLRTVELPGLGNLQCSGLVVLVGPNSSGKSQLLKDIYGRLAGEQRTLVVAKEIRVNKPELQPFLSCLVKEGYFSRFHDAKGNETLRPRTMYLGSGNAPSEIQSRNAHSWHSQYSPDTPGGSSDFLQHLGRLLVTALFLERRLNALSPAGLIDFETQAPQHDLHALHLNDIAKEQLLAEMIRSFGRAVWPDFSRGNTMTLKVSDDGQLPSAADRHSFTKMAAYRSIETEGDGMKSYVATCVALLLGERPVCLIDEPEMCLHPPQAYNLGRFIGRFGTRAETATFVATHSSHLLRGIIQTAPQVQIIRLVRRSGQFHAHRLSASDLEESLSRPTIRAESVLDGVFADSVAVLEADGDRLVYQAAWETLQDEFRTDIHFSTVGGTGGIADTCRLYRALRIPIAVIADLDMLVDNDGLERRLATLVDDTEERNQMVAECKRVAEILRAIPPVVTPQYVIEKIDAIRQSSMDWAKADDIRIKRDLGSLENDINRMRRLKKGGASAYGDNVKSDIESVLARLKKIGVFLVPVGELEEWLKSHSVTASKSKKWEWATVAAQRIHELGKQPDDVWDFVREVGTYLTSHVVTPMSIEPAKPQ